MRVLLKNIRGASPVAMLQIKRLLDLGLFQYVILLETWFSDFDEWQSKDFIACWSLPTPQPVIGHRPGGIAVLCHPSLRRTIHVLHATFHSLSIQINNNITTTTITTSYYPPSLPLEDIASDFATLPKSDLWLGDFNFRLGERNGDTATTAKDRSDLIFSLASRWGLLWFKPDSVHKQMSTEIGDFCQQLSRIRHGHEPFIQTQKMKKLPGLPAITICPVQDCLISNRPRLFHCRCAFVCERLSEQDIWTFL